MILSSNENEGPDLVTGWQKFDQEVHPLVRAKIVIEDRLKERGKVKMMILYNYTYLYVSSVLINRRGFGLLIREYR